MDEPAQAQTLKQHLPAFPNILPQMQTIRFSEVVPAIFRDRDMSHSQLWSHDVTFERGHSYLVEAMSGTGKSTLCSYLLGFRHDYSGTITFDDADIRTFGVGEWTDIRTNHVSHLFQDLRLFPELTAWENVEIKNRLTRHTPPERIEAWFERLGLADKRDVVIGRMSFGQQQRVALMRALVQPFDFLLADEPVSHLDEQNTRIMGEILREEAARQGAGLILTSIGKHIPMDYDVCLRL